MWQGLLLLRFTEAERTLSGVLRIKASCHGKTSRYACNGDRGVRHMRPMAVQIYPFSQRLEQHQGSATCQSRVPEGTPGTDTCHFEAICVRHERNAAVEESPEQSSSSVYSELRSAERQVLLGYELVEGPGGCLRCGDREWYSEEL